MQQALPSTLCSLPQGGGASAASPCLCACLLACLFVFTVSFSAWIMLTLKSSVLAMICATSSSGRRLNSSTSPSCARGRGAAA